VPRRSRGPGVCARGGVSRESSPLSSTRDETRKSHETPDGVIKAAHENTQRPCRNLERLFLGFKPWVASANEYALTASVQIGRLPIFPVKTSVLAEHPVTTVSPNTRNHTHQNGRHDLHLPRLRRRRQGPRQGRRQEGRRPRRLPRRPQEGARIAITKKPISRSWIRVTRVRRSMTRRSRDAPSRADRVERDQGRPERPVAGASRVTLLDGRARRPAQTRGNVPIKPPSRNADVCLPPFFAPSQAAVVGAATVLMASPAFAATIKLGGDNGELGFFVSAPYRRSHSRRTRVRPRPIAAASKSDTPQKSTLTRQLQGDARHFLARVVFCLGFSSSARFSASGFFRRKREAKKTHLSRASHRNRSNDSPTRSPSPRVRPSSS